MSDLIVSPAPPEGARHVAIVPAAGVGVRFGADRPKQYLSIGARTCPLYHSDAAEEYRGLKPGWCRCLKQKTYR